MARVETGARLHFGFQNLSLAHDRLYGGVGVALREPRVVLEAEPAPALHCPDEIVRPAVERAVEVLGVSGASVSVHECFESHVGLGSGTQLALAALVAIARAHGRSVASRALAPAMGRGGRSGVGVETFSDGGFVVDAGHPTKRFTTEPPEPGSWTVPEPLVSRPLPRSWRFLVLTPDAERGLEGTHEDERMRAVVERADPGIADDIATLLVRHLLPAVAEGDLDAFGAAVARLGRLNGAWYADEQGGVYRPPAGPLVEALDAHGAIVGAGQSSWGPTVYGVTDEERADDAIAAAHAALDRVDVEGRVGVTAPRNSGVTAGKTD